MARIQPIAFADAQGGTKTFMDGIKAKFDKVPNFFATIAHAPETAIAFTAFNGALANTSLTGPEREAIALAQASYHGCPYCAAAHTAIAKGAGVEESETRNHLAGIATDAKTQALIDFAQAIVRERGQVSDAEIAAVRAAGYDNAQIIETIAVITANTFTNFVNIVARTDVDFPKVDIPQREVA